MLQEMVELGFKFKDPSMVLQPLPSVKGKTAPAVVLPNKAK